MLAHFLEVTLQAGNALLHAATVHLELGFAGAPRADAAGLARKVRPHAGQPREKILQLGQLDLQAPLAAAGAAGEDVEDELRAVENLARGDAFEVPPLRRGKLVVEDDGTRTVLGAQPGDLLGLPLADVVGRCRMVQLLRHGVHHLGPRGGGEFAQFGQRILQVPAGHAIVFEADEDGLLGGGRRGGADNHGSPDRRAVRSKTSCVTAVESTAGNEFASEPRQLPLA